MPMTKVAIVVQRCHESIVGGSEALAWQYASLLSTECSVELLTTTALDYVTWANELPAGTEKRDGITIQRFPVTVGRGPSWDRLAGRMFPDYRPSAPDGTPPPNPWPAAAEEELLRIQGPYSEALLNHLRAHVEDFQAVLFVAYLYPTTYFGMAEVPEAKALLVPTLHDEPLAYLRVIKQMARRSRSVLWLTETERQLGRRLWGDLPGRVTAMAVATEPHAPARPGFPYLLYAGRIDTAKGCDRLLTFFRRFKQERRGPLRLVLIGEDKMGLPNHPDIDFRGMVCAENKFALMAGALGFVMPSTMESFSIATLEAMAQRTPVLANGAGEVVAEHVQQSGGGKCYHDDYSSFAAAAEELLVNPALREELGARGRAYVLDRYQEQRVRDLLVQEVLCVPEKSAEPAAARGGDRETTSKGPNREPQELAFRQVAAGTCK